MPVRNFDLEDSFSLNSNRYQMLTTFSCKKLSLSYKTDWLESIIILQLVAELFI